MTPLIARTSAFVSVKPKLLLDIHEALACPSDSSRRPALEHPTQLGVATIRTSLFRGRSNLYERRGLPLI